MKPNAFEKITSEIQEKFLTAIASKEIQDVIAKTKSAQDSGTFEVVISTADRDRQGEVIDQKGWDFVNYKNNPVVLWGHNYFDLPIGVADEVYTNEKGQTIAKGRFAPEEANPFAQQVRRLYDAKIVRTTSVGFIAREMEGSTITKAELLEFSFVPVPANPMALSLAKELNINAEEMITKGLFLKSEEEPEEKKAVAGEVCTTENGKEGTMQDDGNGTLVCIPNTEPDENEKTVGVLSEKMRTSITSTITGLKATIAALEDILKGNEGEEHHDGDASKQRSSNAGSDVIDALKAFNANRQVLRLINNITSDALRKINDKHRSK